MAGIYPHQWDGGIPPNERTPDNPAQAFKPGPYTQPLDTSALYYGNGCDVRIRAPVINSIISEFTAVLDRAGIAYEAARLDNLARAIETFTGTDVTQLVARVDVLTEELVEAKREINTLKEEVARLKHEVGIPA